MSNGGKGDKRRPTDNAAYTDAHRRIFGEMPPWYVKRDERARQEQENEHRQAESEQASTTDKR